MNHLIEDIKGKGATSVIVSHDISLAVEHADKIVYIDKMKDDKLKYHYGFINDANTYVKQAKGGWSNQISYADMQPPVIDGENLIEYFKEKIINQNTNNE